jgi:predicted Ser/Thr protein kinase
VNDISEAEKARLGTLITQLEERNRKEMEKIVNSAIMNADNATCQRIFDEYVDYAKAWMSNSSINTLTGETLDINRIINYLETFEKRAGITNGPDFRRTTVNYVNNKKSLIADQNFGKEPKDQKSPKISWDSYEPVAKLIRAQFEVDRASKLHILRAKSEADLRSDEEKKQFSVFHDNMRQKGYTDTMVSRMLHHLSFT